MKKILYVYAHPNPVSFNHLLMQSGMELLRTFGHDISLSDLYAQHFEAVASWEDFDLTEFEINPQYFLSQQAAYNKKTLAEDIHAEINKIKKADHIIFQFPLWWFSTPAILKGWFDRVWVKGFAYDAGKVFENGLLKGKTASLVVSTQSPESAYKLDGVHGGTIDVFLKPIHHTLRFVGVESVSPFVTYNAFNIEKPRQDEIVRNYRTYLEILMEQ